MTGLLRRARVLRVLFAGALCAGIVSATHVAARAARRPGIEYLVIVHATNPVEAMTRDQVSRLFLKKAGRWPDGREAAPLDLAPGVPVRQTFSRGVHGKGVRAVKAYWQQQIFSGQASPPPELATEAEVVAAVRANPLAIGYVSDEASLSGGVKILDVLEAAPPGSGGA